ncbi:YIP1 family protein [Candidatus Woesearchaeota archaeon]|nr:YIP1 family protein [Candidatus Woesearchaeota archaeon]
MASHKNKDAAEVKKQFTKEHTNYPTLVGKVRGVLFECSSFFEEMKARASVSRSFVYFAIIVLVYLAVVSVVYAVTYKPEARALPPSQAIAIAAILGFAVSVIFLFVSSVLAHTTARFLKGTGTYAQTLTVVSFGSTPAYLLGWVPFFGLLAIAYGAIIQIKGIAIMHDLSQGKAATSILFPLALILAIGVLLLVWSEANPFTAVANSTATTA